MSTRGVPRGLLAVAIIALTFSSGAAANGEEGRGIDPNQGDSLVEVVLPDKAAAIRLQLDAETYGVDFNDHYLRHNANGSVTATVFATEDELASLQDAGFELGGTIEGPATWQARLAERQASVKAEKQADAAALGADVGISSHDDEIVVLRVDYFENYDGRFLSVEAKNRDGAAGPNATYVGPVMSLSFNSGAGTPIDSPPRTMNVNIDQDTTPDTYIEHRELVRIGEPSSPSPGAPTMIRIGSSTGASVEAPVQIWLGGGLPPMTDGFLNDFTTGYMDPTQVYERFEQLAAEFPNLAELITLPHKTNGYQRRAQANMNGLNPPGSTANGIAQTQAVVLTSRQWGHEGGNDVQAEFVRPGAPNATLGVSVAGNRITVSLGTDAAAAPSSTAAQVVQAINGHAGASSLVVALTYRGNAGTGIVQPRTLVNLSDFLTVTVPSNAHVQRGPFEYSVMRIGKQRKGNKVGVFLYCQQHAREWATPLTCLETAEQLLRNYTIDKRTRKLVDGLDIFILPSSNPDGSHYSMYNFPGQRRNMTNHCVTGGLDTDDPFAPTFWSARTNPGTGALYTNTDAASRTMWGVDLNRNNTVGTIFDGYVGASHSCNSDVYAGREEASEPEIKNELWIADTFKNIKFSNNIHSFGGYFMWAPGTYLPNRDEGEAVHANIGVEKYFFLAGDRILNRIKEHRNTAILPERTGPVADVLYSAAGNSADEHWYRRNVIAYSFETGADRYVDTSLSAAAAAGVTGIRLQNRTGFDTGDKITIDAGAATEEVRFVASVAASNPSGSAPNVTLTTALSNPHAAGAVVAGGTTQASVGFQPNYAAEGRHEALEFAAGNYGLLESALDYAQDDTPPEVTMSGPKTSSGPITTTFVWVNEPSVIRYTTDGSKPNDNSPLWDSTGPREPGEVFHLTQTTTFKWTAVDIKGNTSTGSQKFTIKP